MEPNLSKKIFLLIHMRLLHGAQLLSFYAVKWPYLRLTNFIAFGKIFSFLSSLNIVLTLLLPS